MDTSKVTALCGENASFSFLDFKDYKMSTLILADYTIVSLEPHHVFCSCTRSKYQAFVLQLHTGNREIFIQDNLKINLM